MLIMPYELHKFDTIENSEILVMEIAPELFLEYDKIFRQKRPKNPVIKITDSEFHFIRDHLNKSDNNPSIESHLIFYYIFSRFLSETEFIPAKMPDDTLRKAISYVSTYFDESINLKSTAQALGVNHIYLSRIFSKSANIRFDAFVNSFRIKKAPSMRSLKLTVLLIEGDYLC